MRAELLAVALALGLAACADTERVADGAGDQQSEPVANGPAARAPTSQRAVAGTSSPAPTPLASAATSAPSATPGPSASPPPQECGVVRLANVEVATLKVARVDVATVHGGQATGTTWERAAWGVAWLLVSVIAGLLAGYRAAQRAMEKAGLW